MKKINLLLILFITVASFSQEKPNYNIGLLLDDLTPEQQPLLTALQKEIHAVVGEDATVSFPQENVLSNGQSLALAQQNYQRLLNNNTDIIIAFGAINNELISKLSVHAKPTILFGAMSNEFNELNQEIATSGVKDFTYLIAPQSFKKDLSTFKELTNFKQVTIAVERELMDILPFKTVLDRETASLNVSYKTLPFASASDIINNINENMEALYLAGGFFLSSSEIKQIAATLIEEKVPSFTATDYNDVNLGLMATNQSKDNLDQFFRRVALNVEAYINGNNLGELPVYIADSDELTLNYNTVESLRIPLKYSLIGKTNFVGALNNTLSQKRYDLLGVMKDVVSKNLSLQSSKRDIQLTQQDVKTAKSNYLPDISASSSGTYIDPDLAEISGGQNPEFSTSGQITVSQVLFSESANANIKIQKHLLDAEEENYNTDVLDAVFEASSAYFNALILKTNVQIQKQNLDLTKKNLEISNQKFDAGESGKSDVLRFTSEMVQNTQSFIEAANMLERAYFALNQLLNNPMNYEIEVDEAELGKGVFANYDYQQLRDVIDDPKLRASFVKYLTVKAKENAPELKSLQYNLKATKRDLRLNASGRFLPTLALQGSYNRDFNQWGKGSTPEPLLDDNYNIGLNLSVPLFKQNRNNINKQTAMIRMDQLNINKENIELNIEANINNAILDLINEITNIEISEISERTAKESLELTQTSYSSGAVNIVQLLDAQSNYLQAQLSKANASYNYLLSSLQLERYIGHYFLLKTPEQNEAFIQEFYNYLTDQN